MDRTDTSPGTLPGVTYFIGLPAPPPALTGPRVGPGGSKSYQKLAVRT